MRRHARHRGFTLLELTLAAAMVAIIGVSLAAALNIGFRARTSANNQVNAMREAAIAIELVQQDFASVVPPTTGVLASHFIGTALGSGETHADSVEFFTIGRDIADDGPLSEGQRRVQIVLVQDGASGTLVRRVERNLLANVPSTPEEEVLVRNVRSFGVRYFNGYGWLSDWDSTLRENVLPLAVEVNIALDVPSPADASRPYRVSHVIPISTGRFVQMEDPMGEL
jgi:type II secretion system protein J